MSRVENRLLEIARRKERLIARSEAQRVTIAGGFHDLRGPISIAGRGLEVVRFLRAHPVVVGIALAAVMAFRGRGLMSLVGRGLAVWRAWRALSAWSAGTGR